jgi:GNAT superfamily N-acetyltransferase
MRLMAAQEAVAKHLDLHHPGRCSEVFLSRGGAVIMLRFAEVTDAAALQAYFRGLTTRSRYNRLMGGASELPAGQLARFIHAGAGNGFSLVATLQRSGGESIIGEMRYAIDDATNSVEIALSVIDGMQRQGIGTALLDNLAGRAASLGADRLLGDTLRSNDAMLALARKTGFVFAPIPGDWTQIRMEKTITRPSSQPPMLRSTSRQNLSTHGRISSSELQALRGCCNTCQ